MSEERLQEYERKKNTLNEIRNEKNRRHYVKIKKQVRRIGRKTH